MTGEPIELQRYEEALNIVIDAQQASVSMIQRKLRIGYTAASKIIDRLEQEGHISPYNGSKPRTVNTQEKPAAINTPQDSPSKPDKAVKPSGSSKRAPRGKTAEKGKPTAKKPAVKKTAPKKDRKGIGGPKDAWTVLNVESKIDAVRGWAMQGATIDEIAEMIGVGKTTVYKWQSERPEFAEALRAGRYESNGALLNAAFKASTGFMVTNKVPVKLKKFELIGGIAKQVEYVEVVESTEYIAPNAQLLQFMLTNRLPEQYKKKDHVEHSGTVGQADYSYMSDEELDAELSALKGEGPKE